MGKKVWLLFLGGLFLAVTSNCTNRLESRRLVEEKTNPLGAVRSFAVIYRKVPLTKIGKFDLLILDPDAYTAADFTRLRRQGKIVLGYLNLGEVEAFRWYAPRVPESWLLGPNPDWPEHRFVNVKKKGWRKLVTQQIVPRIFQKGAQGLFLDSVDLASPARQPELQSAMVKLIRQLHRRFPDKLLIINNGQFLLPRVATAVSGLAAENVFTEPGSTSVTLRSVDEVMRIVHTLAELKHRFQLPVFVVDYVPESGNAPVHDWAIIARHYGLILYVGDPLLQRVPAVL